VKEDPMPEYVIERHFGPIRFADLDDPAWVARREAANARFPEIEWLHSHIIETDEELLTYCIYRAPSAEYVRDHARAAGVPADRVSEARHVVPGS
jgi:hypothetical protein